MAKAASSKALLHKQLAEESGGDTEATSESDSGSSVLVPETAEGRVTMPDSILPVDVARWIFAELHNADKLVRLDYVAGTSGKLRVVSLCCGMGADLIAAQALSDAWPSVKEEFCLKFDLEFDHKMMCENAPWKRVQLMTSFPHVGTVFGDVSTIQHASAFCYKANKIVPVGCDKFVMEFVSHLPKCPFSAKPRGPKKAWTQLHREFEGQSPI